MLVYMNALWDIGRSNKKKTFTISPESLSRLPLASFKFIFPCSNQVKSKIVLNVQTFRFNNVVTLMFGKLISKHLTEPVID